MSKEILVLGSTGSIGTQTLDVVRGSGRGERSGLGRGGPGETAAGLSITGLAAGRSWRVLLEQAREFGVRLLALADREAAREARPHLPRGATLFEGEEGILELVAAARFDTAVHGIVGGAGLPASVAVLRRGKTLALANKESLVIAGEHLTALAREHGAAIVPVDSEHSAIFQCLRGEDIGRVRRVLLTASGGPFRRTPLGELESATTAAALAHPNWDMGPRITIGSATLMNKALEVIELHHLFGLGRERIEVVVHPQSIVHSMVEFVDGSVIAQLGLPDMRGPIHYALHHPDRAPSALVGFDLERFAQLTFEAPDHARFPALALGFRCVEEGADSGAVLNAADEVAVAAFLAGEVGFTDIARINGAVLDRRPGSAGSVDELLRADQAARRMARDEVRRIRTQHPSPTP